MNELIESPFAAQVPAESAGSRQLQQRENAETLAMVAMAHRFPRNVIANTDKILNAFTRATLAEKAEYQFAKGGSDVSGPSIRAAEAIAQMWGNLSFGFREISRGIGADGVPYSEVEAFCWDMEAGNRQPLQFIVRHWRDTKRGGYQITDERDIYELIANQAQRRKRACILALVPGDVVEAAMNQADVTLRTKADTSPEAMAKMVEAFAPFGVTKEHIEKRIQRRLDSIQPAQVVMLKRVYASLRDDMSTPADWFDMEEGAAGDAPRNTPAPTAAPTAYPDELFKKNLPGWRGLIEQKKKTADQVIAMAQTKHPLTDVQKAAIRGEQPAEGKPADSKPAADGAPVVTFAQVADAIAKAVKAKDPDALSIAGDLIGEVQGPEQRTELSAQYEAAEVAIAK